MIEKLRMAREVAIGMDHLTKNHFIHRDLAGRNVLVTDGMCKVADFGLSRGAGGSDSEEHEDYYKSSTGVFPVRWTAPEAMETLRFTPASDVWSFGIVVIELLTDGQTPYHGMSNPDVMNLTMSGGRHAKPPLCTQTLFEFLLGCWQHDPKRRPTFETIATKLKGIHANIATTADANITTVEAAACDKLARGSAANVYSDFQRSDFTENVPGTNAEPSLIRNSSQSSIRGLSQTSTAITAAAATFEISHVGAHGRPQLMASTLSIDLNLFDGGVAETGLNGQHALTRLPSLQERGLPPPTYMRPPRASASDQEDNGELEDGGFTRLRRESNL
jgi:serine/threonine protein kinase